MRLSLEKREKCQTTTEDSDNEDGYYDETETDNDNMVDVLFQESDDEDED